MAVNISLCKVNTEEKTMPLTLNAIGQVSLTVDDVDVAEKFYVDTLGLRKLFRFGTLLFLDCAGLRLLVEPSQPFTPKSSVLYFRVADISLASRTLRDRGVTFVDEPHLIAPMEDHDLWMTFFKDPAGNLHGLMQEAPKGYSPS
jgi:methylmalonyl-CoA/ethylmalonyl-CoA epimerase